jgi:hypothetical protein
MKIIQLLAIIVVGLSQVVNAQSGFEDFKPPISNPIYFESPFHTTEARLIHLHQKLHGKLDTVLGRVKLDGALELSALQLRYAVSERFSIIATKDGYGRLRYGDTLETEDGFADLALGVKYSPYMNVEAQSILTLGLRVEVPTGDSNIFQGRHDGIINPFLSFAKGFGNLHVIGYQGLQLPVNTQRSNTMAHTSLHVDYKIGNFYPALEFNLRHVLSSGSKGPYDADVKGVGNLPVDTVNSDLDAQDISNLGTSGTQGETYINWAFGLRYKLSENVTLGAVYESPLSKSSNGLFAERFTFDIIYTF